MGIGHARGRLYAWREDGLLAAHAGREDRQQPAWAVDWVELDWQWPDGAGHWARLCCCQFVFENKQASSLGPDLWSWPGSNVACGGLPFLRPCWPALPSLVWA